MSCIICTNVEQKLERTNQNKRTDEVKDNNKLITKEYQPLEAIFHMIEAQPSHPQSLAELNLISTTISLKNCKRKLNNKASMG